MRTLVAALLALCAVAVVPPGPSLAQDAGMPSDAWVELRNDSFGALEVVIHWTASGNVDADYEVWRRTPWDLSFQVAEPYADVDASARLIDGTFEFVDPAPFSIPERPCYMIGATTGAPTNSWTLAGCIPTRPEAMPGLRVSALPAPYPNTWYVTGTGFAPGAHIQLQEQTCAVPPCPGPGLSTGEPEVQASIDGRFSVFAALPTIAETGGRRIVAYERGWLPSQLAVAPIVPVATYHSGTAVGHPISTRTGLAGPDRVLAALESREPARIAELLQIRKLPALSDGQLVDAIPRITCGNGDALTIVPEGTDPLEQRLNAFVSDFIGLEVFAVFQVTPNPEGWQAFEGATHAIVLASAFEGRPPRAAVIAVNDSGIVGAGQPCGAPPTYYLRDAVAYVLAPSTAPADVAAPAVGNSLGTAADQSHLPLGVVSAGLLLAGAGWLAWASTLARTG